MTTSDDRIGARLHELGQCLTPEPTLAPRVMQRIAQSAAEPRREVAGVWIARLTRRRSLAVAAAMLMAVVLGWWPLAGIRGAREVSAAAWGAEISSALAQARVRGVTIREHFVAWMQDGSRHESSTNGTLFLSGNQYRRDWYEHDDLRETQWYVYDESGMTVTSVRYDQQNYDVQHVADARRGVDDPIEAMRRLADRLDDADRRLGTRTIEGHECLGFEIAGDKLDGTDADVTSRIWFDVNTKLPVLTEFDLPVPAGSPAAIDRRTMIQDGFDWDPQLPANVFTPDIPQGFAEGRGR